MRHAQIGTYAQHERCRPFYATRWFLLASSSRDWYLMRYARVSFWIQASPCSIFHTWDKFLNILILFYVIALQGSLQVLNLQLPGSWYLPYSEWKSFYVCSSSPSVYNLDWAYFCGARRYRSRIARRRRRSCVRSSHTTRWEVDHGAEPAYQGQHSDYRPLSFTANGRIRRILDAKCLRDSVDPVKQTATADGRQGGISPFVSLFPTAGLQESIIGHADAVLFPNSDELFRLM